MGQLSKDMNSNEMLGGNVKDLSQHSLDRLNDLTN